MKRDLGNLPPDKIEKKKKDLEYFMKKYKPKPDSKEVRSLNFLETPENERNYED